MSHARIGYMQPDNSVVSIFVHGIANNPGNTLLRHYMNPHKVVAMMRLGDMVALQPELAPPTPLTLMGVPHNMSTPVPGVCIFYGRDTDAKGDTQYVCHGELDAFLEVAECINYIMINGQWHFFKKDNITIDNSGLLQLSILQMT